MSAVIQNGYLSLLLSIFDCNSGINWIVVAGNVLPISNWPREPWIIVDFPLLHFEAVSIGPELLVDVKIVEHLPVNGDILSEAIFDWDLTQFDLVFNELVEELTKSDLNDSGLLSGGIVVSDSPLIDLISMLESNIGIKSRILQRSKTILIRLEKVRTLGKAVDLLFVSIVDTLLSLVVFHVDSESLGEVLLFVLVFKHYLTIWRNTLDSKTYRSLLTILQRSDFLHILGFDDLSIRDFIWFNLALNVHFIIDELTSGVCNMLLLQNIIFNINEGLISLVPALSLILLVWKSDSEELFEGLSRWVVTNNDEFRSLIVFVVINWTLNNRIIL